MRKTIVILVLAVTVLCAVVMGVLSLRAPVSLPAAANAPAAATRPAVPARPTALQEKAFYEAVAANDVAMVGDMLRDLPSLVRATSAANGETPLHLAPTVQMAQLLIDAGADGNARDRRFNARPTRWATSNWHPEVAAFLDARYGPDADIAALCATGRTTELMTMLTKDRTLAQGQTAADVLGSNRSLLHVAALFGQAEVCRVLASHGAEVASEGGFFNAQPLEFAAWAGFPEAVKALIEYGADVNAPIMAGDQGTHTAIWWAALTGRKEVVAILLEAGATVEPELVPAVRNSQQNPYPGRALPPPADYAAVADMLQKHLDAQKGK